jgi:uncharacterized protein DUF748
MRRRRFAFRILRSGFRILIVSLLSLAVLAVVLDVTLDAPLRRHMERAINESLDGYHVRVRQADFHVLGFSIDLKNSSIYQNAHPDPPVAFIPKFRASVQWRALLSRRLVANIRFERPTIHINLNQLYEEARDPVPIRQRGWQDALEAIYPLKINDFEVREGTLVYQDVGNSPPLRVSRVYFHAGNIRNIRSKDRHYPSNIRLAGIVFEKGKIFVDGHADFMAKPLPGVTGALDLQNMELGYFQPMAKRNNLSVRGGSVDALGRFEYASTTQRLELDRVVIRRAVLDYLNTGQPAGPRGTLPKRVIAKAKQLKNSPDQIIRIRTLDVLGSEVGFVNQASDPPYRIFVTDGFLEARNFSNQNAFGAASVMLAGKFMGSGEVLAQAGLRPAAKGSDFDVVVRIDDAQIPSLNQFLRSYAHLDVAAGTFSFYAEARVKEGHIEGYVKPLFKNIDIYDSRQDRHKSVFKKLYEKVAGGIAKMLKNEPRKEVATVTSISGPVEDVHANTMEIVGGLIKNAFFRAILPGFESHVKIHGKHRKERSKEALMSRPDPEGPSRTAEARGGSR